jgi:hypothetical protein
MTGGGYMIVRNADGSQVNVFAETDHGRARAESKRDKPSGRTARRLAAAELSDSRPTTPETDAPPPSPEALADAEQELAAPTKPQRRPRGGRRS